jgi:hypothetical protein
MMETYPTTLPQPDYGSYAGNVGQGLIRTSIPVPAPNQVIGFNTPRTDWVMTFTMDNDTYKDWIAWVEQYGFGWFLMPVVSRYNPVLITSTHRVRMTTEIQYTKAGDNWLSVTVGAELVPGADQDPLAPTLRLYEFVDGGSPTSPLPDFTQPGTPASPSTDYIIGNIYDYEVSQP